MANGQNGQSRETIPCIACGCETIDRYGQECAGCYERRIARETRESVNAGEIDLDAFNRSVRSTGRAKVIHIF